MKRKNLCTPRFKSLNKGASERSVEGGKTGVYVLAASLKGVLVEFSRFLLQQKSSAAGFHSKVWNNDLGTISSALVLSTVCIL